MTLVPFALIARGVGIGGAQEAASMLRHRIDVRRP
jgi:hypothetical protein